MNKELVKVINEALELPLLLDPKIQAEKGITKEEAIIAHKKGLLKLLKMKAQFEHAFVIADHYQLSRVNGNRAEINSKTLITKGQMVVVPHLLDFNSRWNDTYQVYILDEKATDEHAAYIEEKKKTDEAKRDAEKMRLAGGGSVASAKKIYGVTSEGKLYEDIDVADITEYEFTGSKLQCDKYIKNLKQKNK